MSHRSMYDINPQLEVTTAIEGGPGYVDHEVPSAVVDLTITPDGSPWATAFIGDGDRPMGKASVRLDRKQARELAARLIAAADDWDRWNKRDV